MPGADFGADGDECVLVLDPEFGDLLLKANLRLGEMLALRLVDILLLGFPGTQLHREIAIAFGSSVGRSEEHTSELQSLMLLSSAVFCLKKQKTYTITATTH